MSGRQEQDEEYQARVELLRKYLEKTYSVRIDGMERLERGVFMIKKTEGPSWVARVFPEGRSLEQARGDVEVLRFLEKHDFPSERCIGKEDPVSFVAGRAVVLTDYVEGTSFKPEDASFRELGESMARLHSLPPGTGAVSREAGALHHYARQEGPITNELASAATWLDSVNEITPSPSRAIFDDLSRRVAQADRLDGLPHALIHPDPGPRNVITRGGRLTWIDWTGAGRGPRVLSLAMLLWAAALNAGWWSQSRVQKVVEGYLSHSMRLEQRELDSLDAAMSLRPLVFACWRFRHSVRSGEIPDGSEHWMPDDKLVDEISSFARGLLQ